jgi:type III restriction enzyme
MSRACDAPLRGWFTGPTPFGAYNRDWAVLVEREDGERLYFVERLRGLLEGDLPRHRAGEDRLRSAALQTLHVHEDSAEYVVSTSGDAFVAISVDER